MFPTGGTNSAAASASGPDNRRALEAQNWLLYRQDETRRKFKSGTRNHLDLLLSAMAAPNGDNYVSNA